MAAFLSKEFGFAAYAANRPEYPESLFNAISAYHDGLKGVALDLGTGHGNVARQLSPSFQTIIAIDPAKGMLAEARRLTPATMYPSISYHQAIAEELHFLDPGTVDLAIAATCAHLFEAERVWCELTRIVRPRGTVAFFTAGRPFLVDYPKLDVMLNHFMNSPDWLGPYWAQRSYTVCRNKLQAVECQDESNWTDFKRLEYRPGLEGPGTGTGTGIIMSARWKLEQIGDLLRTWSSFYNWQVAHPDSRAKKEGGTGDIVDRLLKKVVQTEDSWRNRFEDGTWRDIEVDIEIKTYLLLTRRKC